MRRIFWFAIFCLTAANLFAQDSLNITRVWQSEPAGSVNSIARDGDMLYAAQGSYVKTFDISNFDAPQLVGQVYVDSYLNDINEVNGIVYVAADSLYIVDCRNPTRPLSVGSAFGYGSRIAVNTEGTNAFTISTNKWSSYDISNETQPVLLRSVPIQTQWNADIATYGGAAYVSTLSGLKIYDVSDPTNPVVLDSILTTPGQVASCVEIIDDTLYVLKEGILHIYELTFPLQPVEIGGGFADQTMAARRIAKSDTMLAMAGAFYWSSFASISDLGNPVAYPHFLPENMPRDVIVLGRHALFANGIDDFHLVDFSDPNAPVILDTVTFSRSSQANAIVGNVLISGSMFSSGLWTADISNPEHPSELDRQYSFNGIGEFEFSGQNMAALLDSAGGFELFDIQDQSHPNYRSTVEHAGNHPDGHLDRVAMSGDYLYAAFDSVSIYDISDLENPVREISGLVESPVDLVVSGGILYVLARYQVFAYSLANPVIPIYLGGYAFGGTRDYIRIVADGTTIYLYGEGYVQAVDLSNPQTPVELSPIGFWGNFRDMDAQNGLLAISSSSDGVFLVQYADPLNPVITGFYSSPELAGRVTLHDDMLVVSSYYNVTIYDISAALPVREETRAEIPTEVSLSAYPNPFNPNTTIAFSLNARAQVSLNVYDVTGRLVTTLLNQQLNAGSYTRNFDAEGLPSGAYFARLVTPQVSRTTRITLIR